MNRRVPIALVLTLAALGRLGAVVAQETDDDLERWARVYSASAAAVRMEFADGEPGEFVLVPQPLLEYVNPVRGVQQHGTIHLWMEGGRPRVVASFWSAHPAMQPTVRRLNFEWHTLHTRSVRAEYDGKRLWETDETGPEWKPLPNIAAPAPNERLRLLQMRRIAARFEAEIERGESELRLMTQPLYRYPAEVDGLLDGAMFAFVMGTDPELFVLIEALPATGDDPAGWQAGIVRFTNSGLEMRYDGNPWWSCERFMAGPVDERYFLRFGVRELPADLSGTEFADPESDARSPDATRGE